MKKACKKFNACMVVSIYVLSAIFLMIGISCASYSRINAPLKERCLLEYDSDVLTLKNPTNFISSSIDFGAKEQVNYYSGLQTLFFKFTFKQSDEDYVYTYSGEASITYDFEAGHHYRITLSHGIMPKQSTDRKDWGELVKIEIEDLGSKTAAYRNNIYSGMGGTYGGHIGSGGLSYFNIGIEFGTKLIFDIGTPFILSLNIGGDFNFGPPPEVTEETAHLTAVPISSTFGAYSGIFGKLFIPQTVISIGGGYGYRIEGGGVTSFDSFYSPFWRGEISYSFFGLYFEHYFNPAHFESGHNGTPNILKDWGVGLFYRL